MRRILVPLASWVALSACTPPGVAPSSSPPDPAAPPSSLDQAPPGVVGVTPNAAICGADLAATTFRFGLCTCDDVSFSTVLRVDAFAADPANPVPGGSVGTNGSFTSTGDSAIAGSLVVGGSALPIGNHEIGHELRVQGNVTAAGDIDAGHDAYVGGDIGGFIVGIGGTLHVPAASQVGFGISAAATVNEPVQIEAPCPCEESDRLDIDAFIADALQHNDNAAIGLTNDALVGLVAPKDLVLPPGRYVVDRIQAIAPLEVFVSGPTALYVAGDLESVSILEVHIEGAGELDIFVGGSLRATGDFELKSDGAPAKVRTYVAGAEDILLAGDLDFGGNLWAPNARLVAAGPLDVEGSLVLREVVEAGIIHVGWDASVLDGAGTCDDAGNPVDSSPPTGTVTGAPADEPAAPTCDTCADCGNQACTDNGTCGSCSASTDCCAPLICSGGACIPLSG